MKARSARRASLPSMAQVPWRQCLQDRSCAPRRRPRDPQGWRHPMTVIEPRAKHGDASDGVSVQRPAWPRIVRTDGPPKISGAATYALEHRAEGLLHCVIVQSTIGAGRIVAIDRSAAEASPGVRLVLDAGNSLKLRSQAGLLRQQAARRRLHPVRDRDPPQRRDRRRRRRRHPRAGTGGGAARARRSRARARRRNPR